MLLAQRGGVSSPAVEALTTLPDGSVALAVELVHGPRLDELAAAEHHAELLDSLWRQVAMLHAARLAHRSLRAANVLVDDGRPVIIDLGFGAESADARLQAIDRAELLASLASLVGAQTAIVVGREGDRARCARRRAPIPATSGAVARDALRGEQAGPR